MAESGLIGLHGMDGNRYYYDDDDDDDDDAVAFTSCTFDVTQAYNHVQTSKSYRQHALAKASFFHTESFYILISYALFTFVIMLFLTYITFVVLNGPILASFSLINAVNNKICC